MRGSWILGRLSGGAGSLQTLDEADLIQRLGPMGAEARTAFAAACAERQLWSPALPESETPEEVYGLLASLWDHLLEDQLSEERLSRLADRAEALVPESESADAWTPATALAENAIGSLAYALYCAVTGEAQFAVWSARQVFEALDVQLSQDLRGRVYDRPTREGLGSAALIKAELGRQAQDLYDAAAMTDGTRKRTIAMLRKRARADSRTLFE